MGRTLPIFSASGKTPEEKDRLKICDRGEASMLIDSFIGKIQRPSAPSLLLFFREETTEETSSAEVGESRKLLV